MKNIILISGLFLLGCGTAVENSSVSVACAANMQYAMDSIAAVFEAEEGIKCEITAGSSGMLAAQIENGAPYDLFISADLNYPQTIFDNGNGEKPFTYAKGRLVFVVGKNTSYSSVEEALLDVNLTRIGLADTRLAPYGIAADQCLKKIGLNDSIASRIVVGESIGQINQYLTTGSVDAAFTSYSFRIENEDAFQFFEVNPANFDAIEQAAMMLNHGVTENKEAALKLANFMKSTKCKAILTYFGYLVD